MKLLHLYYDFMNLYGEYGNIVVLKKHLEDQGLKVEVDKKTLDEDINFLDYDFIYCGSGLESNQKIALNDLLRLKESLVKAIELNKVVLFTGNAMELLGESIDDLKALNIVDIKTMHTDKRHSGDVVVKNKEFGELVGFINKSSIVKNDKGIFEYVFKDEGLNDDSLKEGYRLNNLIGTHIIGPILVKNPNFMRYIINLLTKDIDGFKYKDISYPYEEDSYNVTLNALKNRKN